MDAERIRSFLLQLPHVTETLQWGENLVFWVGERTMGGKIFAIVNLGGHGQVVSYVAGPERFSELVEREGIIPAPYLARAFWVGVEDWKVFRPSDWEDEMRSAHEIIFARLPKKKRVLLELPHVEEKRALGMSKQSEKKTPSTARKQAPKTEVKSKTSAGQRQPAVAKGGKLRSSSKKKT